MSRRQRTALLLAGLASLAVLAAAGVTRAEVDGRPCEDRTAVAALRGQDSGDPRRDACTAASQDRGYVALASLMGLVLISGVLTLDRD